MKVKAINGVKVPFEHRPHQYIEQEVVEVENSVYYQRRIADGDLVKVTETQTKAKNKEVK
ncbi:MULTISPECIES: DUF2635 domain-containing protein [Pasteurellaceae]|uniref:DUF2635 domain-containing protein n=1 Tax=Pasteurella atlantica TaxID=2827233 RepID=A0AAW8CN23_9PAST|nr:DUF2635 domain-containing protein [Pasteurella atlantica]MBR0574074.1 DUF2635 domain-containing protein [Pasteurella atlantica]MDP8040103.1 DUF2635 domain-containing protein [Pasteurella atlantica]MDP8042216.1 DUF2635 domain-containing protein [Pasteurella atlantica]MDP8046375.1 DUF2635 domain-containing protein [Pasteurella atlantica]MDP8062224.1 DUF2635 domain-containing protein [Pasteurella atlantica]